MSNEASTIIQGYLKRMQDEYENFNTVYNDLLTKLNLAQTEYTKQDSQFKKLLTDETNSVTIYSSSTRQNFNTEFEKVQSAAQAKILNISQVPEELDEFIKLANLDLEGVRNQLDEISQNVSAIKDEANAQIDSINRELPKVTEAGQKAIEDMNKVVNQVTASGQTLQQQINELDLRLSGIVNNQSNISKDITAIQETNKAINASQEALLKLIDKTDDRIDQINQQIGDIVKIRTDIDTLKINKADKTFVDGQLADRVTNVKSFGVKGDGVTDDTLALRAAFSSGKPLWFPVGTHCMITDALSVPTGKELKIIGSGKDNCSIKLTVKNRRIAYINGNNTEIEGISFYGTGQGFSAGETENGALLDFIGKGGHIHNCRFKDADYLSILVKQTGGDMIITNNLFENAWAEEIAYWASDGIIKNNSFKNCQNNAIVTRGSDDVLIEGNLFQNIGFDTDAAIDIRNSYEDTPRGCERITIHNNHFIDCYFPLSASSETDARHAYVTVTNNKFFNPIAISYDNGIRLEHCRNVIFDNNQVRNLGTVHSVLISASENIQANGNTIDTGNHGLNLNGDTFVFADNNKLINLTGTGIIARCPSTNFNSVSANGNKFFNVNIGIEMGGVYVGRMQLNMNLFRTINTMAIKITYTLNQLITVGNHFADGNASKTIQTMVQPTTWVKGENINYDPKSGGSSTRPANPTLGQQYFDTSINKPIFCRTRATLDANGAVTTAAVWVDGNGTVSST